MASETPPTITPLPLSPDDAQTAVLDREGLKDRRRAFVLHYVVLRCATTAACRSGYSARSARQQGARLLADSRVKAAITIISRSAAARAGVDAVMVFQGLLREARGDGPDTNSQARVKAWLELAGLLGMNDTGGTAAGSECESGGVERGSGGCQTDVAQMTDAELEAELARLTG